jgi:SAM-dependent methyltransferase
LTPKLRPDARNEVESVLLEHPDIMGASLLDEEGPDGHIYAVAYVVPHAERMKAAKSQIYLAGRDKRIVQWRKAFDQNYRSGYDDNAPTFVGWNSSYTNKPVPDIEMREWLDRTAERISALGPDRVLEIGCGVGLLLQKLAPRCRAYCGTDLSPVAVSRLRKFVATRPELCHVELVEREATNFEDLAPASVDMVVINSVAQYFPDLDYLRTVLERAAQLVVSGGHIFVGDVRNLALLPFFHGSVQIAKAPAEANVRWLKRKVSLAIAQERELVIHPLFFLTLSESIPRITGVETLLKRGPTNNELTRYRYDVLLRVDEAKCSASPQEMEWQASDNAVAALVSRFDAQRLTAVRILDVPNSRISRDAAAVRLLGCADDRQLVKDLRKRMAEFESTGTDPEAFWKLADMPAYDVRVGWSPHSPDGRFDVALVERNRWPGPPPLQRAATGPSGRLPAALATDPLAAAFMEQLGLDLGKMLRARLPEPLLPAAVLAVNEMPIRQSKDVVRP